MNQTELIEIAKNCGLILKTTNLSLCASYTDKLAAFAKEIRNRTIDENKADAERYRWLRDNHNQDLPFICRRSNTIVTQLTNEYVNKAIDLAMKGE